MALLLCLVCGREIDTEPGASCPDCGSPLAAPAETTGTRESGPFDLEPEPKVLETEAPWTFADSPATTEDDQASPFDDEVLADVGDDVPQEADRPDEPASTPIDRVAATEFGAPEPYRPEATAEPARPRPRPPRAPRRSWTEGPLVRFVGMLTVTLAICLALAWAADRWLPPAALALLP